MKTYTFGLPNSDRIITIQANNLQEALRLFREQLKAEGLA